MFIFMNMVSVIVFFMLILFICEQIWLCHENPFLALKKHSRLFQPVG